MIYIGKRKVIATEKLRKGLRPIPGRSKNEHKPQQAKGLHGTNCRCPRCRVSTEDTLKSVASISLGAIGHDVPIMAAGIKEISFDQDCPPYCATDTNLKSSCTSTLAMDCDASKTETPGSAIPKLQDNGLNNWKDLNLNPDTKQTSSTGSDPIDIDAVSNDFRVQSDVSPGSFHVLVPTDIHTVTSRADTATHTVSSTAHITSTATDIDPVLDNTAMNGSTRTCIDFTANDDGSVPADVNLFSMVKPSVRVDFGSVIPDVGVVSTDINLQRSQTHSTAGTTLVIHCDSTPPTDTEGDPRSSKDTVSSEYTVSAENQRYTETYTESTPENDSVLTDTAGPDPEMLSVLSESNTGETSSKTVSSDTSTPYSNTTDS